MNDGTDVHEKEGVPLEDRKSTSFMKVVLCKQDKEQLNKMEEDLRSLELKVTRILWFVDELWTR